MLIAAPAGRDGQYFARKREPGAALDHENWQVRHRHEGARSEEYQDEDDGAKAVLVEHLDERSQRFDGGRSEFGRPAGSCTAYPSLVPSVAP
jgi:hypothetical protein